MGEIRYAFAGDREISVKVLKFLLEENSPPLALLVPSQKKASHAQLLKSMVPFLEDDKILKGKVFREQKGIETIKNLNLDYIFGIHFPYIVPKDVLSLPKHGVLNLHPAYLPFNRGWHTPSWAILDNTPIGATLHFMDEDIDTGDIVCQEQIKISSGDTAHSLYKKINELELKVFKTAWPQLSSKNYKRISQKNEKGTSHNSKDLFKENLQRIDLNQTVQAHDLICRIRALTTNQLNESAYYEVNGKRFRIQAKITEEKTIE